MNKVNWNEEFTTLEQMMKDGEGYLYRNPLIINGSNFDRLMEKVLYLKSRGAFDDVEKYIDSIIEREKLELTISELVGKIDELTSKVFEIEEEMMW